ncbi:MAG: hypothetical protein KF693_16605 [Nitrospira sp.]|nr:hypothetical protein [Nitrospira sp.]
MSKLRVRISMPLDGVGDLDGIQNKLLVRFLTTSSVRGPVARTAKMVTTP